MVLMLFKETSKQRKLSNIEFNMLKDSDIIYLAFIELKH